MNESITRLIVSLDLGASASKGMYSIEDSSKKSINLMLMEPEIAKVPILLLEEEELFDTKPENAAWISHKAKDKEGVAVGTSAKKYVLAGEQIESVKYEFATDKCLAFIGAIAAKHGITENKLEIVLNLLIPSDEKQSKRVLEKNLTNRLKNFYFKGEAVSCNLSEFNLQVEGTGGLSYLFEQNGECDSKTYVVLMLGHRNCSCLVFDKGSFVNDSVRLGYFDYIQNIKQRSIGQNLEALEFTMPKVDNNPNDLDFWIDTLIRGNLSSNQKEEKLKLINAIEIARKLHWEKISNWLDAKVPERLDEILIFGGASFGLRKELSKKFSWIEKINWGEEIIAELEEFSVEESIQPTIHRFTDVYGLHKQYSFLEIKN